jgi:hypothetical protein
MASFQHAAYKGMSRILESASFFPSISKVLGIIAFFQVICMSLEVDKRLPELGLYLVLFI